MNEKEQIRAFADDIDKLVDYKVCFSASPSTLQTEVSDLIAQGWQPRGDLHVAASGMLYFIQVMVKLAK